MNSRSIASPSEVNNERWPTGRTIVPHVACYYAAGVVHVGDGGHAVVCLGEVGVIGLVGSQALLQLVEILKSGQVDLVEDGVEEA